MNQDSHFYRLFWGTMSFSFFFIVLCSLVFFLLPAEEKLPHVTLVNTASLNQGNQKEEENLFSYEELKSKVKLNQKKDDAGLALYRQMQSRVAVEWFYIHISDSKDVALAILEEAEKNDIPLSLAFALAHTESNFNVKAKNTNSNSSVDRGLFQLNSNSFPNLSEEEFYDPKISAKYGLSHLKHCLKLAGNEISALAMYNAGTNKVRNNGTPQMTLNYISKIENYRSYIEDHFEHEVMAFYDIDENEKLLARR